MEQNVINENRIDSAYITRAMLQFEPGQAMQYPGICMEHDSYCVEIEAPELYIDNEARHRSGHMSHAMAQFAPGHIIAFHSNYTAMREYGHTQYGWVEYRISKDNGYTWGEIQVLPYSWERFIDGDCYISVEKCVSHGDGSITAFCLRNTSRSHWCCDPWDTPVVIRSTDGGKTWSDPVEYTPYKGRTYDALAYKGTFYALHTCNEVFLGKKPEDVYRLYRSTDNGLTFEEVSIVPFNPIGRGYGSLLIDDQERMHAFAYNEGAECEMDHAISYDFGKTWELLPACHLENRIRNPQTAQIDGIFICHGRGGDAGLVFYTSEDCIHWDEGTFLQPEKAGAFYSNNLNLTDEKGNFLLIQYSAPYHYACCNVAHTRLRVSKKKGCHASPAYNQVG